MNDRKPHLLDKLKSSNRPTNFVFFDTETRADHVSTWEVIQRLRLGVAIHCRTMKGKYLKMQNGVVFYAADQFWDYLETKARDHTTTYLVAHNIIFDLVVVNGFEILTKRGWKLGSFYTKGGVTILRWSKGKRKLDMLDNGNLFSGSLASWGSVIGLPKLEVDFESVTDQELLTYCRRDVEIMVELWRIWLKFLDDNDCGAFKPTVASTAMTTWRHRFLPHTVHIHNIKPALQLERDAYHGGRVEVLYQGMLEGDNYYYLDVNNMYGYVLSRYLYPRGIVKYIEKPSVSMLLRKLYNYAVIARVTVTVDENWFSYQLNGHTCYPLGTFDTVLTTPELILALNRGWIDQVHEMAYYYQCDLFSDYVKYFHSQRSSYRDQGMNGYANICKLLINGLYGKFGQQGFEQKIIGQAGVNEVWEYSVYDVTHQEFYRHIALAGNVYEERRTGESYNSFVAIAAHTSAYARMLLNQIRTLVPDRHVYYMDTDSLIVDQTGYKALEHLIQPGVMGKLKIEHSSNVLEINAPKDYHMGDRVKIKGIRSNAVELSSGVYEQDQWIGLKGMIQSGNLSDYKVSRIIKRQERQIFSGLVQPDGWVVPFVLQPLVGVFPVEISQPTVQPARPERQS